MDGYTVAASEFVQSAKGVVGAVDMLKTAISGGDQGDVDFAADILAEAADRYAGNTAKYRQIGFDAIAAAPVTARPKRERVAGDLLASALVDLNVANTLVIAGLAADPKTFKPESLQDLDVAASQLGTLTNVVGLPLGRAVDVPSQAARFGFDEVAAAKPTVASQDLPTAKGTYEKRVAEVLAGLVAETKKVISAAFETVSTLSAKELAEAIGILGDTASELPQLGKLIVKGATLALQALQKVTQMLGSENAEALRKKAKEIIDQVKQGGDVLDKFLTYSYGVTDTKKLVQGLLAATPADVARIDSGTRRLADLQTRFSEQMVIVSRIVKALSMGKSVVGMLLPQVMAVLLFGAFYLLAMDYSVLAGMDFADSAGVLDFVDGVVKISVSTLAPIRMASAL